MGVTVSGGDSPGPSAGGEATGEGVGVVDASGVRILFASEKAAGGAVKRGGEVATGGYCGGGGSEDGGDFPGVELSLPVLFVVGGPSGVGLAAPGGSDEAGGVVGGEADGGVW